LFVKADRFFKLAARVRALSAFKQSYGIGRIVTECFFLRSGRRSATQNKQQHAARRQEEFVPA
jgi:hypothetical protein